MGAEDAVMTPQIVATDAPSSADREAILKQLIEFNEARAGVTPLRQFAVLLRDPHSDETIGGLYAYSFYDWLYIDVLIVPETLRGRGFGTELMRRVEAQAVAQGCGGIWLNTFSFQARGFYEKLGYEVFGALDDHPRGAQRYFMRKRLVV